jgi:hypothetical protein
MIRDFMQLLYLIAGSDYLLPYPGMTALSVIQYDHLLTCSQNGRK